MASLKKYIGGFQQITVEQLYDGLCVVSMSAELERYESICRNIFFTLGLWLEKCNSRRESIFLLKALQHIIMHQYFDKVCASHIRIFAPVSHFLLRELAPEYIDDVVMNASAETCESVVLELLQLYYKIKCTNAQVEKRKIIRKFVFDVIERCTEGCMIAEYGDGKNSFCLGNSDVDVNVKLPSLDNASRWKIRRDLLNQFTQANSDVSCMLSERESLTSEAVLQMKIVTRFDNTSTDVNVTFEDDAVFVKTAFLKCYKDFDDRVHQFCLLIKYWATQRGIANASNGYLSGDSWLIIAIFYLLHLEDPIIVNLLHPPHNMRQHLEKKRGDNKILRYYRISESNRSIKMLYEDDQDDSALILNTIWSHFSNTDTLILLLWNFFKFYAFVFDRYKCIVSLSNFSKRHTNLMKRDHWENLEIKT
ncbi:hypothetical protein IE077_002793, partial [Cardiosporidium cionae]